MRVEHSLEIAAPLDVVWRLTEDVESWPSMTPTMTSVRRLDDGPVRVGTSALVTQPAQRSTKWTVDVVEPPHRFAWSTRLMGLDLVASHLIEPSGGSCRNTLVVEATGSWSRIFGLLFGRQIRKAIATENEGFKRHAELAVAGG